MVDNQEGVSNRQHGLERVLIQLSCCYIIKSNNIYKIVNELLRQIYKSMIKIFTTDISDKNTVLEEYVEIGVDFLIFFLYPHWKEIMDGIAYV